MRVLDRKLTRDLVRLGMQAIAIALVMACGVAVIIIEYGTSRSLQTTADAFYDRQAFADIFASATRAPRQLDTRIREITDISAVELRVVEAALLDIEGMVEPATGLFVSIPDSRAPTVNRLYMRAGRLPEATRPGEVAVTEQFAKAHGFRTGDGFRATMNGRSRQLVITAIVLSPEFVYAIGPGDMMPDPKRFGVIFMPESVLAGIYDLDGAFNDVVLKTRRGSDQERVIESLDSLLKPYGGSGAFPRKEQISASFLDGELVQLRAMATIIPPVFLFISAFLVNMILSRLIALEREQIGLLKAVGYSNTTIALHYAKLVTVIAVIGIVIGAVLGTWAGHALTRLYGTFYTFPFLIFERSVDLYLVAGVVTLVAALGGAAKAIREGVSLPPAAAMRAPAPARYRRLLGDGHRLQLRLSQLNTMSLRNLIRRPARSAMTMLGTSLSVSLLVTALFFFDSLDFMIDQIFFQENRQSATLIFANDAPPSTTHDIAGWPGVLHVEGFRATAVEVRRGHRSERLALNGIPANSDLLKIIGDDKQPLILPPHGLVVSTEVASKLHARMGDSVEVTLLKAGDRVVTLPITGINSSFIGLPVTMRLDALNRLMPGGPRVSGVNVLLDEAALPLLYERVKHTPVIPAIALLRLSLEEFRKTVNQNISMSAIVFITLAVIITYGVIYNAARIQLSESARELASLRVFGFTRAEVSSVLIVELTLIVLIAQPFGWLAGFALSAVLVEGFSSDIFRLPLVILPSTLAVASLVVVAAAAMSMLIVRRRIDRLDLVSVLKTRE